MRLSLASVLILLALSAMPRSAIAEPITVGDGTAASCTEGALKDALATAKAFGGGTIRFRCGAQPVTITLSQAADLVEIGLVVLTIPDNTALDGGGLITLARDVNAVLIFVDRDHTVALKDLSISGFCVCDAGAVFNMGALTVRQATFFGNVAPGGSAIQNLG